MAYKIGFTAEYPAEKKTEATYTVQKEQPTPRRSVVQVSFPGRGMSLAYYNDSLGKTKSDIFPLTAPEATPSLRAAKTMRSSLTILTARLIMMGLTTMTARSAALPAPAFAAIIASMNLPQCCN